MNASDIKGRGPVDTLTVKVIKKDIVRDVRGGELKVCDLICEDSSGKITVTLWNDEIGKYGEGDTIRIDKGWANEFKGTISVSAGKFGTMTKLE